MKRWPTYNDKVKIVNKITLAAEGYRDSLVGKTFLYFFEGRFIEVMYRKRDFAHLTGVEWSIPAAAVYRNAMNNKLSTGHMSFSPRHPFSLCLRKVRHLADLEKLIHSALIVLEDVGTSTTTFKFGVTELNYTLCLDYDLDAQGQPKSEVLIAKSLRDEDCFERSQNAYEVNMIFSKQNSERLYNVCTYNDGTVGFEELPQEVKNKLDLSCFVEEKEMRSAHLKP